MRGSYIYAHPMNQIHIRSKLNKLLPFIFAFILYAEILPFYSLSEKTASNIISVAAATSTRSNKKNTIKSNGYFDEDLLDLKKSYYSSLKT